MATNTDDTGRWLLYTAPTQTPALDFAEILRKKEEAQRPPMSPKVDTRKDRFRAFMRSFAAKFKDSREAQHILENTSSWDDVRKEARAAVDAWNGSRSANVFRKGIRVVGDHASRLEFLTVLIPSGDYTGILCGGLKLLYHAAIRMDDLRSMILDSIDTLSLKVEETTAYAHTFAFEPQVREKRDELYIAVLDAVEEITKWIGKTKRFTGALLEPIKAVIKGDSYGEKLEKIITTDLEEKALAFQKAIDFCLANLDYRNALNVVQIGKTVDKQIAEQAAATTSATRYLENVVRETVQSVVSQITQNLQFGGFPSQPLEPIQPMVDVNQLLLALNIVIPKAFSNYTDQIVDIISTERDWVFYSGRTLPIQSQSRITTIVQDPRFQTWFNNASSQVLTVVGMDLDAVPGEVVSVLSYLSIVLMRNLSESQFTHPIGFFCRIHMDLGDPLSGAVGMIRSLIAQLVLSLHETNTLDLTFLTEADLVTIATCDLFTLCSLFDEILKRVQTGLIVCMIDGANFFRSELHLPAMHCVMHFLNSVVAEVGRNNLGIVFKLLVTSPMGGEYFADWFPYRIELPLLREAAVDSFGFHGSALSMPAANMPLY